MSTPDWLLEMRAITGLTETPGSADNPKILAMRDTIAAAYPEMQSYCDLYDHDETPWCGLTVAYCLTKAGLRPVFGPTDTDKWMWAQAFDDLEWGYEFSTPRLGCIVVIEREGGGHVTLYERTEGANYVCRGGNQSDCVNTSSYAISSVIALIWPKEAGPPPPAPRRTIKNGDSGADVTYLQKALGIPADGEFGPLTDAAVRGFQSATGLQSDGVVGPATWEKIDVLVERMESGSDGLTKELKQAIADAAAAHPINDHNWADRGRSPSGFIAGMGQAFALALTWLEAGNPGAVEMAWEAGDPDDDALALYADDFAELGMSNDRPGADTLLHLFMFMIGLAMRESSGCYYVGRDTTATNTTSDTAEAGLWQASWNIKTASPNIPPLLGEYWADPQGFLTTFSEGLTPKAADLENFGSGQGASYQFLAKYSPCFAAMVTAIGLRTRRSHWGPVGRGEVELVPDAADFLQQVAALVHDIEPAPGPEPEPEPEPEPPEPATVAIVTHGDVTVTVNGEVVA